MATKDKVKGYCKESKCEYDVYTSDKVDELLATKPNASNVYTKSEVYQKTETYTKTEVKDLVYNKIKVVTLTGSYSRSSGGESQITTKSIDYPSGFNKNNTILLAIGTKKTGNTDFPDYVFGSTGSTAADVLQAGSTRRIVRFKDSKIELGFSGVQASDALTVDYKLIIAQVTVLSE